MGAALEEKERAESAEPVESQRAKLERMRQELERMVREVDDKLARLSAIDSEAEDRPQKSQATKPNSGRTLRELILDAVHDFGWPAYSREVATYCRAMYGREIPSTRFGSLGNDESESFAKRGGGSRAVWLCFALTWRRYEPIKRCWARSDWPLEWRIMAPRTSRVQHLHMTQRLCELALRSVDHAANPDMLRFIAADHARDLPGIKVVRGVFDLERWRDVSAEQLAQLEPEDIEDRRQAASDLARWPEYRRLFGAPDVIEGSLGTSFVEREGHGI